MYTLDGSAKAGKGYQAMTQVRTKILSVRRSRQPEASNFHVLVSRRFEGPVYFWNGFAANLEYLLSPTNQSATPKNDNFCL